MTENIKDLITKTNYFNCHDYHDSCSKLLLEKAFILIKYTLKLYSFYHIVPYLIFKWKNLKENPKEAIKEIIIKVLKSAAYLTTFILIHRASTCLLSNYFKSFNFYMVLLQSILCSPAVLFDSVDRIRDYTIFTLPKSFECLFEVGVKLNIFKEVRFSLSFLFALAMGFLIYCKETDEINPSYSRMLSYFT